MNKKNIITLIACIILLLSIANVSALTEDFSAQSAKIIRVGECSTALDKIVVSNTGSITSAYTVNLEGSAANLVSYAPVSFTLKPGEIQEVYAYVKAPCNSKGGYNLETYITTKLGVQKVLKQEISIHETQNIKIVPVVYSDVIDPCETAFFSFDVTNTGDFPEIYEFTSVGDFADKVNFNFNNVTILSGETLRLSMYVAPSCESWGDYTLGFETSARLSNAVAETSGISLKINRAYDYSLTFGRFYIPEEGKTPNLNAYAGDYFLCEEQKGAVPVLIENKAKIANTYFLDLEGNGWTSLSGDVVSLEPGKSAYVNINVAPPEPMRKVLNITFNAESDFGEIEKSEARSIIVDICHIPVIAEGVSRIKTYYNESVAELSIVNTGSKTSTYRLETEGADWIAAEPSTVVLAPGEEGTFRLRLSPVAGETPEGTYVVAVKATADDNVQYIKEVKVKLKEPRFSNMIFDEYLPFTILFIILLIVIALASIGTVVYLDRTKEERAKKREKLKVQRAKEKERKQREKEKKQAKKQRELERKKKQKEKLRIQKQKEKEKKKLEKQKEKERKKKEKEAKKAKKAEAKAAAGKTVAKAGKKERPGKVKWLLRIILALVVIAVAAAVIFIIYKILVNLGFYKAYMLRGLITAVIIIAVLIILETLISKWYKRHVWKTLVPAQKGVVVLSWRKGLGEIVVKLKKPVEEAKISVKRYFWKPTFVAARGKAYQYFEIRKKNFGNNDIDKILFRFRIKKCWLARHNVPEDTIKLSRYNNEIWLTLKTEKIKEDKKYIYYESESAGCSFFAIVGKPKPVKKEKAKEPQPKVIVKEKVVIKKVFVEKKAAKKRPQPKKKKQKSEALKWLGWILLAVILLALVCFGIFYAVKNYPAAENETENASESATASITIGNVTWENISLEELDFELEPEEQEPEAEEEPEAEPEPETEAEEPEEEEEVLEGGIPAQEWDEDTEHTLDLSQYFHDPDNDVLAYTHSPLENIEIEIDDEGIATLKPSRNWFGEEMVVFNADDGKGANVSSNEVRLIVNEVEEPPVGEKIKEGISIYSNYIMMGILILVIIILLIEFRKPIMKFLEED
ncbi:PGF-pre-PGF domain-containing protein [Candidatus Woesearchaeota archaeon]|nr:PGF-pre-PGF domain-containing protein [Candidatus Woesearchaeota archaeon]